MRRSQEIGLDKAGLRILIWMCVLIAANQLGFGAIIPVTALYAEDFGVSNTAIGLTLAIYGLARLVMNVPSGRLADLLGRRWTLALGGILTVIGTLICAIAPTYEIFLGGRFIAGAGAAGVLTGGQIVLADVAKPHNRGRLMAIYQGVFLVTVGAGAWPGGWLATNYGLAAPFWANAALATVVTLIAWFFVPETRPDTARSGHARAAHPHPGFLGQTRFLLRSEGLVLISMISLSAAFARTGGLFNVIPLLADQQIGLTPSQIGLGLGMVSILGLVLVYPSGMLVDSFGRKWVIVPSTVLSGVAMVVFTIADSFAGFMVASIFWATSSGIAGAAPAAYAADVVPRELTASAMGLYRALSDVGYVIGPLALGAVSDVFGPDTSLWFTAAILFAVGATFAIRAAETRPG
jgi:MFS transporter, DHA1 family, multidrug resistance protein